MAKVDLSKYGITGTTEVVYNPSYEQLFEEETKPSLEGYEVGKVSELGAVDVMTGIYTGRSPKDKFIVMDDTSRDTVWWTSDEFKNDNKPASQEAWDACKKLAQEQLSNKRLFVMDVFCGANHDSRMAIRFIVEVAWQAHFVKNMFIQPTAEELENFEPDFISYNAAKAKTFSDARVTFTEEQVRKECARCLGCGATKVDSYLCIGCGLCTTKCKFDAIHLKKVRDWHAGSYETMPIKVAEGVVKRAGSIVKKAVSK